MTEYRAHTDWIATLRGKRRPLALVGAVAGLLAAALVLNANSLGWKATRESKPRPEPISPPKVVAPTPTPPIDLGAIRRRAWEKIAPRLLEAEAAGAAEVGACLRDVAGFFDERKQGIPEFSADILSLSGKWQLVRGKLPFAAKDRHVRFLTQKFDEHVFKPAELESALQACVVRYVKSLQSLENELLIHCRADISESDLAAVQAIPVAGSAEEFAREFERLVKSVVSDVQVGLGVEITQTVATLVAADLAVVIVRQVGTAVATQLGVDAGILGVGAGASWATFGISLVAAIVVDILLDKVIKAAGYDPVKKVSAKVQNSLDRLQVLILDGDAETHEKYDAIQKIAADDPSPRLRKKAKTAVLAIENSGRLGLRHDLLRLNEKRSRLRSEALKRLVLQGETL